MGGRKRIRKSIDTRGNALRFAILSERKDRRNYLGNLSTSLGTVISADVVRIDGWRAIAYERVLPLVAT